ncbi:putative oxidoreductase [Xylariaceae sp. FL1272]|nr:putative oxidoreductase [Xylariaceae sp. FL1272]
MSFKNSVCQSLVTLLGPEKVVSAGSDAYNASISSYFTDQAVTPLPLCVALPSTTAEVSQIVTLLISDPTIEQCDFAIRSGGHSTVPNAANAPGSVTIDLQALNTIQIRNDSVVSVGAGAKWDAVYAKLGAVGRAAAGGRIGGVGVSGLTLGGGISYFGPRHGWTCDTAVAFEVVLADGSVVEVDEAHDPELLAGLRGSSNNLGIVTRIDFRTFEQGQLWHGSIYSALTDIEAHAEVFADITQPAKYDENASFLFGFGYSQSQNLSVLIHELVYTKPVENPSYYQGFIDLPSVYNASSIVSAEELAIQGAALLPIGQARYLYTTTTFLPTSAMTQAAFSIWNDALQGMRDIKGLSWSISLEPIPPSLYKGGAARNVLGLEDRTSTLVVCLSTQTWQNPADDDRIKAASTAWVTAVDEAAHKLGALDAYRYLNYAAQWQDPIGSYGSASLERLRKLQARVDPHGVFTRRVPGGFKIPA